MIGQNHFLSPLTFCRKPHLFALCFSTLFSLPFQDPSLLNFKIVPIWGFPIIVNG